MKAMVQHAHGGPEVLRFEEVDTPTIGPRDALVSVRATCLNRLDVLHREGPPLLPGFHLPHIAGMDVAGEIVAVGEQVTQWSRGDRVVVNPALQCGGCRFCRAGLDGFCPDTAVVGGNRAGGYAELCSVPATHIYRIPDDVDYEVAATVPTVYSTAWQGLVVCGRLTVGETVLIHAAASGVSVAAIQLAKRAGATVIATAGTQAKLEVAERLGADVMVNNRTEDVVGRVRAATGGEGVDVVFDHVGPALFGASLHSLRPQGRLVFCGTTTGTTAALDLPYAYHFGISLIGVAPYHHAEFERMLAYYWGGSFEPVIDSRYPLAEAARAQQRLDCGDAAGKVVLLP
ncbi:MAG: zinc-binding dehydrogenase [Acidimicrobiaceae bacterium]|nr:zinc-binding dehydrogenase [Acidimicrobiaceae bacterium]